MNRLVIYRLYCNTCDSMEYTDWVTEVPTVCPNCSGSDIDSDSISIVDMDKWPVKEIRIPMGDGDKAYVRIISTSLNIARKIVFPGTSRVGTPSKVEFYIAVSSGTGDIRLRDMTNNNTIAYKLNASSEDIYVDADTSNWPEDEAILAVQGRVDTEGENLYISDVVIIYSED